ncbi:MAG: hypothetical protein GYA24_08825 [Candidatus Lokiarchaeota archaeon]|nr:hypothetical protein [Candidatus Lokiarchaeota archaeon]
MGSDRGGVKKKVWNGSRGCRAGIAATIPPRAMVSRPSTIDPENQLRFTSQARWLSCCPPSTVQDPWICIVTFVVTGRSSPGHDDRIISAMKCTGSSITRVPTRAGRGRFLSSTPAENDDVTRLAIDLF